MATSTLAPERSRLSDSSLDALHHDELRGALDDPQELARVRESHRIEWSLRQNRSSSPSEAPKVVSPVAAVEQHLCSDCNVVIPPTGKRGRPAKRCPSCKATFEAAQAEATTAPAPAPKTKAPAKKAQEISVTVLDPNNTKHWMEVHLTGCADLDKPYRGVKRGQGSWNFTTTSREDAAEEIASDFISEGSMTIEDALAVIHFAPCLKDLV